MTRIITVFLTYLLGSMCCYWGNSEFENLSHRNAYSNDGKTSLSISGEIGDFINVVQDTFQSRHNLELVFKKYHWDMINSPVRAILENDIARILLQIGVAGYLSDILVVEARRESMNILLQRLEKDPSEITGTFIQGYIRKHRKSPFLASLLGLAYFEAEEFDMSVRQFKRASLLTKKCLPQHELFRKRMVGLNASTPQIAIATARLNDFLKQEEKFFGRVANLYGRAHFDLGNWQMSVEALQKAVAVDSKVPEGYEWLARAYDRNRQPKAFFSAWAKALNVDPWASDRNVWPVFCMTINHPAIMDTPRLNINREWNYIKRLGRTNNSDAYISLHNKGRIKKLLQVVKAIRTLECTPKFVAERNQAMHDYHDFIVKKYPERDYSFINFAYGMVFFHTFHQMFYTIPMARNAITFAQANNLEFIHLGSNVGTETLYAALTWGLKSVGYDVLCNLVEEAEEFKKVYNVGHAEFHCKDALEADLSNAAVVWIDNQSWDEDLTNGIFKKLAKELPMDAIVIEYAASDYHADSRLEISNWLEARSCASLDVSWDNQEGTTVTVYGKRLLAYTPEYNRWDEYLLVLKRKLESVRYMVTDMPKILHKPMQWFGVDMQKELEKLEAEALRVPTVLTYQRYTDRIMELFQRVLFNWYCLKWYNLHGYLMEEEIEYLELFFSLHGREFRAFNLEGSWKGNRMSSYTYSHSLTVGSDHIDSTRFRFGTLKFFDKLWKAAKKILNRRGIKLNPYYLDGLGKGNFSFHGLGWDVEKQLFKIYLMYHNFNAIPKYLRDLTEPGVETLCLQHGLISFSYTQNSKEIAEEAENPAFQGKFDQYVNDAQLREEKVYVYPEDVSAARDAGLEVPSYTGTLALMFTSKRGMVPLYDIERGRLCSWRSQFPPAGLLVADAWSNVGLPLETISYQSATEYSMYFPSQ